MITTYPKVNSLMTIECFVILWSHLEPVVWSCDIYKWLFITDLWDMHPWTSQILSLGHSKSETAT